LGWPQRGGNFILGKSNTADATSYLSAPVAGGQALNVSNLNTTTGSTALRLNVATGHAPLSVNSVGKVPSLNADLLDSHDSTYFLPRTALRQAGPVTVSAPFGEHDVTLATVGQLKFIGVCDFEFSPDPPSSQAVGLRIVSSTSHAAYADMTLSNAGTAHGDGDMSAGFAEDLAYIQLAQVEEGIKVFTPVTGEALTADGHEVSYNLYMGQNIGTTTDNSCVYGGSFAVK
jgi:hypothetical protein